jgi:hypothetical protein
MKYSVEIKKGIAKETLVFRGKEYTRTTRKTDFGSISDDDEFNEQINEDLPSDVLDLIFDTLDPFLAGNLLDIAESE